MPEFITPMTPDRPTTVPAFTRGIVATLVAVLITSASALIGSLIV